MVHLARKPREKFVQIVKASMLAMRPKEPKPLREKRKLDEVLCGPEISAKEALKKLDHAETGCLIVTDERDQLLGTLTDGDVRRHILSNKALSDDISDSFNRQPHFLVQEQYPDDMVPENLLADGISIIPVVDAIGKVVDYRKSLEFQGVPTIDTEASDGIGNVPVIIMAGGRGTRLEPFTSILPKPLVPVHGKPIIDHIIERFVNQGATNFFLTVNYKSGILKAYFEEHARDYQVKFIEEQTPLGTAGSLAELRGEIEQPFFVTNCDILVKADYGKILASHKVEGFDLTLVACAKEYIIPYGTCDIDEKGELLEISEKPKFDFLVNTGCYLASPSVLSAIPLGTPYDMTDLIADLKKKGHRIGIYPVAEDSWVDVGQWEEYRKTLEQL